MKKSSIMIAMVAIATVSQAASVWWTCTGVTDSLGGQASGLAYFVNAATLSSAAASALSGKGADAISKALANSYSFSGSAGNYGVTKANAVSNADLKLSTGGGEYDVYLVLFDSTTITDKSSFYVTSVKSLTALAGADDVASVKWNNISTATSAAGAWNAVGGGSSIPEPTSAMLLLLGFAGLALKRKNA